MPVAQSRIMVGSELTTGPQASACETPAASVATGAGNPGYNCFNYSAAPDKRRAAAFSSRRDASRSASRVGSGRR